jgi:hypothetical protein
MNRIYEVRTETDEAPRFSSYKVAAKSFKEAVAKVTKVQISPYQHMNGERISEVIILASED